MPLSKDRISSYERAIIKLLDADGIKFEREKSFEDLKHGHYRFDFYIPKTNSIVEVHGEQHYRFIKCFYKNRSEFLKAQGRDRAKISYCLSHNIQLFSVPFWEIKNLKAAQDVFQDKFKAADKFHNDKIWREYQRKKI